MEEDGLKPPRKRCGCAGLGLLRSRRRSWGRGGKLIGDFADLEAGEAADGDVFAEVGDRGGDFLTDRDGFVLDKVLLVEAGLLVELFHLALDNLLDDGLWLPGSAGLRGIDFALLFEHFGRDVFAADVARVYGSDVHGDVVTELLEGFGAGHEIAFAIDLDDYADFSASMDVVADETLGGFARGLLGRRGLAFFAKNLDGLFDQLLVIDQIPKLGSGFDQGGTAIAEAGVGEFAEFLDELGWDFHDWF